MKGNVRTFAVSGVCDSLFGGPLDGFVLRSGEAVVLDENRCDLLAGGLVADAFEGVIELTLF